MSSFNLFKIIVIVNFLNLMTAFEGNAQQDVASSPANEFGLALSTEVGSIDNFLHESDNPQRTSVLKLSPSLFMKTQFNRQLVTLGLDTDHYSYQQFSEDDHTDFAFKANHQYKFANNKSWFINGNIQEKSQLRGTGLSLGEANTLNKGDEKQSYALSTGYSYGSAASVAKLNVELGLLNERFNTRRDQTRSLDKESQFIQIGFDYLMSGQSYFSTDFIYDNVTGKYNPSQDKHKYTGLVGFKWQSSVITQVEVFLGYKQAKFKTSNFSDQGTFSWRAKMDWSPLATAQIAFGTGRTIEEANTLTNSFRIVDRYQAEVVHDLTEALQSTIGLEYRDETIFFENSERDEAYITANMMLKYKRNQWFSVFVKYSYSDFQDTPATISYHRNGISLGFRVTI